MANQKPTKTKGKPSVSLPMYAALHENNLALCLAGGFLQFLPSSVGSGEFHHSSKGMVFSSGPVPMRLLRDAMDSLDYGTVVLAEVLFGKNDEVQGEIVVNRPVAIANVSRAIFKTKGDADDFSARVSSFPDVPQGVLKIDFDSHLFGDGGESPDMFQEAAAPAQSSETFGPEQLSLDKVAGAIVGILAAVGSGPGPIPLEPIRDVLARGFGSARIGGMLASLVRALDSDAKQIPRYEVLAQVAGDLIADYDLRNGFVAIPFLDALLGGLSIHGLEGDEWLARFMERAKKVLSARADLAADAFVDSPGKVFPRALLLFVLNPDIERLFLVAKKTPNVGPRIFLLACALAGCYSGFRSLPAKIKAPTREAFVGTTLLAASLCNEDPAGIAIGKKWNPEGNGQGFLTFEGHELVRVPLASPPCFLETFLHATSASLSPLFCAETGDLSIGIENEGQKRRLRVSMGRAPVFPREDSVELSLRLGEPFSRREAGLTIAQISDASSSSGIFARLAEEKNGKRTSFMVELFVFCPISRLSNNVIAEGARELVAFANTWPVPQAT